MTGLLATVMLVHGSFGTALRAALDLSGTRGAILVCPRIRLGVWFRQAQRNHGSAH